MADSWITYLMLQMKREPDRRARCRVKDCGGIMEMTVGQRLVVTRCKRCQKAENIRRVVTERRET